MDATGDCHCTWYAIYVPNWVCWIIHILFFTLITLILVYTITFAGRTYFKRYDEKQSILAKNKNGNNQIAPQRRHSVMIFVEKNEGESGE